MHQVTQLQALLSHLGRHLRLRDGLRLAARSLWVALLLALLSEVVARFFPLPHRHLWAALPLALWLASLGLYSLLRPLPLTQVARRLDSELRLKDRLATALELAPLNAAGLENTLSSVPANLSSLQLADALAVARQISPQSLRWHIPRRPLWLAAGLLLPAMTVLWLPNPMDAVLARQAALQQAAQEQAQAIEQARREFEKTTDPTSQERAEALQALAELMKQLSQNPGDLEQALAHLAQAEAKLRELQDTQAAARQTVTEQIANQLANLARAQNQAAAAPDTAAALMELAAPMGALDAAAQQELGRSLEQLAAQAAPTDADLAQALADLAAAARSGDVAGAVKAADAAGAAKARADQAAQLQQALAQAQAQLAQSRQTLAQGQGQGQGQSQSQSQGPGQGQAQQVGGGGGSSANQLPGANRTGAAGAPTQPNKPPSLSEAEKIYAPLDPHGPGKPEFVPGQETGQGQAINRQEQSPQAGVANPVIVPYQQVYQNYAAAAAEAMEREQIPPDMRDLVRDYFSQLAPE
jgi:hypothetical protein